MPKRDWGPGKVLSRRVSAHIDEILPATIPQDGDVHFTALGAMQNEVLPPGAVGGIIELSGLLGENSQFTVEVSMSLQRRGGSASNPREDDWQVSAEFSRVEGRGPADLEPFQYYLEWTETTADGTHSDSGVISLPKIAEDYRYGRSESMSALLLTEIIANRKASKSNDRHGRVSHAGSLAMLGSFHTAVDEKRIPGPEGKLDWAAVDALLGPDADTLAAQMDVSTTIPEKKRRAVAKGVDFLSDDNSETASNGGSTGQDSNPVGGSSELDYLLTQIKADDPEIKGPPIVLEPDRARARRDRLESTLQTYPEGFVEALQSGNFGVAARRAEQASQPYEKMVLLYGFWVLYDAIVKLQESERAVRQIAAAISAFGTAIDRGDADMAELSLKRASDAFVTITKELVNGAQTDFEDLRGLLAYEGLQETFDQYVANREELGGSQLAHYESVCEGLVEAARRQHERAEKAREVFYRFTNDSAR